MNKKLVLSLGLCLMFVLAMASTAFAKPEYSERSGHPGDCYYCHDQNLGNPTATSLTETGRAYRAEGHPQTTADDPWEPSATDDQYFRPDWNGLSTVDDPIGGRLELVRPLEELTNGIGILGSFFGGEKGGFIKYDIGPLLESLTRGSTQACTKRGCHQEYAGRDHYMGMKPSGTDCYLCHTKHIVCGICHEIGKPGDSITNMINGRLYAFGVPLQLPPIIDQALRAVPLVDVHKIISHAGLILEYAPGDVGAVIDTVRALTGDDPSHYLAGTLREVDSLLMDKSIFKINQLPLFGGSSAAGNQYGSSAAGNQYGASASGGGLLGGASGGLLGGANGGLLGGLLQLPLGLLGTL